MVAAAPCLILRNLLGMVNFAVIDPASVDVERQAKQSFGHDRAFKMPAGSAAPPGAVPFHLPRLARRGLAPDREIGGVALARDFPDPPFAFVGAGAGEAAIVVGFFLV